MSQISFMRHVTAVLYNGIIQFDSFKDDSINASVLVSFGQFCYVYSSLDLNFMDLLYSLVNTQ